MLPFTKSTLPSPPKKFTKLRDGIAGSSYPTMVNFYQRLQRTEPRPSQRQAQPSHGDYLEERRKTP